MNNFEIEMENFVEIYEALRSTSSSNDKKDILTTKKDKVNKSIWTFILSDLVTLGITSKGLEKVSINPNAVKEENISDFLKLIDLLSKRKHTGHEALTLVKNWINFYPKYESMIKMIIDKKVICGINSSLFNKVFPGTIPVFEVALADRYNEKTKTKVDGNYRIQMKLDGTRLVNILNDGSSSFFARSGKEYTGMENFEKSLSNVSGSWILDGELCDAETGGTDFNVIAKQIMKKDHVKTGVKMVVFDVLTPDEFYGKVKSPNWTERLKRFEQLKLDPTYFSLIESVPYSPEALEEWDAKILENNWEGLILRKDCPYNGKRSADILKYKNFEEEEYVVEDLEFSDVNIVENGKMIVVKSIKHVIINHKGFQVDCAPGKLTKQEKIYYTQNPSELIGKTITVKFKKESQDKNGKLSLQFPTLKMIHGIKREF